jgi:hypothetical protein
MPRKANPHNEAQSQQPLVDNLCVELVDLDPTSQFLLPSSMRLNSFWALICANYSNNPPASIAAGQSRN